MREMLRTTVFTLATLSAWTVWSSSSAQSPAAAPGRSATAGTIEACSLLTNAEVAKITGRRLSDAPGATALVGGGSACTYGLGAAQIILFSGEKSEERFNTFLEGFGHEKE